jgi:hypothetical protein
MLQDMMHGTIDVQITLPAYRFLGKTGNKGVSKMYVQFGHAKVQLTLSQSQLN